MPRVLFLEDEGVSVMLATALLEEAGFEVLHVTTTDEASEVLTALAPDILLSDWSVAGSINAAELARQVRAKNSSAKIIFVTGHAEEDLRPYLADLAPYQMFHKPVEYEEIVNQLEA